MLALDVITKWSLGLLVWLINKSWIRVVCILSKNAGAPITAGKEKLAG